jgi:hypothetical protein
VLSRLGLPTAASGSVTLVLDTVHQAKAFLVGGVSGAGRRMRSRRLLMDRLGSATLFSSVNTVLEAFRRAREKMAAAKEGLETGVETGATAEPEQ